MKTFACITTFNQDYYDQLANKMVETYLEFWPKDVPLYCYTEDMSLPLSAENLKEIDIYEACNPNLKDYLDYIGTHFSRGFAYKAFAWIHACRTLDVDQIIYLDADSVTYRVITKEWLDSILPEDKIAAYMGVTMNKGKWRGSNVQHADTGVYWFNRRHEFANAFINRYENIYLTKEVDNRERFPKPNDAYVFADCVVDAQNNGVESVDFHPERTAHSPLKETVLGKYFRHFKANRKDKQKIEAIVKKLINSTNKFSHNPDKLAKKIERLDRKLRHA